MFSGMPYKKVSIKINCQNCLKDLKNFVHLINDEESSIEVLIDQNKLNQQDFQYIQTLPYILQSIDEPGNYELGNLRIKYNLK